MGQDSQYAVRFEVDYPEALDRVTSFFRLLWVIPIAVVYGILSATASETWTIIEDGQVVESVSRSVGGIAGSLVAVTALMIIFREKYPRWWFDFAVEFARFGARIGAYLGLLTDAYPSTDEEQSVHLDVDYPDVTADLSRWMPLVKWLLAIPHYIVLAVLFIGAFFAVFFSWWAILFTGRYPQGLFDYVVGVARWALRVQGYVAFLVTDDYPPFSLR